MRRPPYKALKLLLASLVLLGAGPRLEVRHRHDGGSAPHRHGREGARGHHAHHHGAVPDRGEAHDHHDGGHGHATRESSPPEVAHDRLSPGEDWHVHVAWFFGLFDEGRPGLPGSGPESRAFAGPDDVQLAAVADQPGLASVPPGLALLISVHGPPRLGPADPAPRHLSTLPDRRPPAHLCDVARHERSGVQLI